MKIIFAGTPDFAVPSLKTLIKNFGIRAVITQPDRPCGRGQKIKPSPVKEIVLKYNQQEKIKNIPIFTQPINQLFNQLTKLQPDLIVVAAYGQILYQKIIDIPQMGAINLHPSLLPKYRGPSPIHAAILNGDRETGVSIIKMTVGLDAGPIIAQSKIKIAAQETTGSLHDKLALLGAELLEKVLTDFKSTRDLKSFHPYPQNNTSATYTKKNIHNDAQLDLSKSSDFLERQIRAYNPWPGAWLKVKSYRLKIWQAKIKNNSQCARPLSQAKLCGHAMRNSSINKLKIYQNQPAILCGDGQLLILTEVQPEGKKRMSGEEFARGYLRTLQIEPT